MSRGPCTFRQRDVRAAVKAVEASGHKVERVDFAPGGTFSVVVSGTTVNGPHADQQGERNEWDQD